MAESSSQSESPMQYLLTLEIKEVSLQVQFPCSVLFSLKCGYESIFDVDKYKLEGKVIHPNSTLKSFTTLSEEQFLNIYLSAKSGLINVGSIRLDIVGGF